MPIDGPGTNMLKLKIHHPQTIERKKKNRGFHPLSPYFPSTFSFHPNLSFNPNRQSWSTSYEDSPPIPLQRHVHNKIQAHGIADGEENNWPRGAFPVGCCPFACRIFKSPSSHYLWLPKLCFRDGFW
ncbi:hypothetical protein NC652_039024 [Populus alba x Populus x berolinensis]|nr:hypothetical protein NC652_039024 [Populus alba x Populus x berolinensis]